MIFMTEKVREAFLDWQQTFPGHRRGIDYHRCQLNGEVFKIPPNWDGNCGCPGGAAFHLKWSIDEFGFRVYTPRSDQEVCERERRWRKYVQVRDSERTLCLIKG